MARAVKVEISDEQYKSAISALENGATKKAACEILNIKYNTTRLDSLINAYVEGVENDKRMRKKKRGTPISDGDMVTMIEMYFEGEPLHAISKRMFRSQALIKFKLEQHGAMLKTRTTVDPMNPPMLPEECIEENFELKERVWVAGYNCLGEIDKRLESQGETVYRVYLLDRDRHRYVYYAWYELGSLRHLESIGLNVTKLGSIMRKEERDEMMAIALKAARMRGKD